MLFGYSLPQVQKAVVAFIGAALLIAGYFIAFEPGTEAGVVAVAIALLGVYKVAAATNHTPADLQKAIEQAATAVYGLIVLYASVDPSVLETVLAVVANVGIIYAVWRVPNAPSVTPA